MVFKTIEDYLDFERIHPIKEYMKKYLFIVLLVFFWSCEWGTVKIILDIIN